MLSCNPISTLALWKIQNGLCYTPTHLLHLIIVLIWVFGHCRYLNSGFFLIHLFLLFQAHFCASPSVFKNGKYHLGQNWPITHSSKDQENTIVILKLKGHKIWFSWQWFWLTSLEDISLKKDMYKNEDVAANHYEKHLLVSLHATFI